MENNDFNIPGMAELSELTKQLLAEEVVETPSPMNALELAILKATMAPSKQVLTTDVQREVTPRGLEKLTGIPETPKSNYKIEGLSLKDKTAVNLEDVLSNLPLPAAPAVEDDAAFHRRVRRVENGETEELADMGIEVCPAIYNDLRAVPLHKREGLRFRLFRGIKKSQAGQWLRLGEIFTIVRNDPDIQRIRDLEVLSVVAIYLANDFDCTTDEEFCQKHHSWHHFWTGPLPSTDKFLPVIYSLAVYHDPADPKKTPDVKMRWRTGPLDAKVQEHPYKAITKEVRSLPYSDAQRKMLYEWTGMTFNRALKTPPPVKSGSPFERDFLPLKGTWGNPS